MPKKITITMYTYAELSDDAKANAHKWYRQNFGTSPYTDEQIAKTLKSWQMIFPKSGDYIDPKFFA